MHRQPFTRCRLESCTTIASTTCANHCIHRSRSDDHSAAEGLAERNVSLTEDLSCDLHNLTQPVPPSITICARIRRRVHRSRWSGRTGRSHERWAKPCDILRRPSFACPKIVAESVCACVCVYVYICICIYIYIYIYIYMWLGSLKASGHDLRF